MLVYRIQPPLYAASCLSGEGARLNGGRWNPKGIPLVYVATTPELALLETLVHLSGAPFADQPPLVLITIAVSDEVALSLPAEEMPIGWDQLPVPTIVLRFLLPRLGPASPVLGWLVPSVVLPVSPSRCALLNPLHRRFMEVHVLQIEPMVLDARLRPAPTAPARR